MCALLFCPQITSTKYDKQLGSVARVTLPFTGEAESGLRCPSTTSGNVVFLLQFQLL